MVDLAAQYVAQINQLDAQLRECRTQNLNNIPKLMEIDTLLEQLAQASAKFQPRVDNVAMVQQKLQNDDMDKFRAKMELLPSRSDSALRKLAMGQGLDPMQSTQAVREDEKFRQDALVNSFKNQLMPLYGTTWALAHHNGDSIIKDIMQVVAARATIPAELKDLVVRAIAADLIHGKM